MKSRAYGKMLGFNELSKANLATFLATFCKVRQIRHIGVAQAFASPHALAARIAWG
jgi:hypothetical protein